MKLTMIASVLMKLAFFRFNTMAWVRNPLRLRGTHCFVTNCWPSDWQKPAHRQRLLVSNSIIDPNPTLPLTLAPPHDPGNLYGTDKCRCLWVGFCPSLLQPQTLWLIFHVWPEYFGFSINNKCCHDIIIFILTIFYTIMHFRQRRCRLIYLPASSSSSSLSSSRSSESYWWWWWWWRKRKIFWQADVQRDQWDVAIMYSSEHTLILTLSSTYLEMININN